MNADLVDPTPIWAIFVIFALLSLLAYELGFRLGGWWQDRMPGEQEGPAEMIIGAILALMAFLLAVTMAMASDRFDDRRGMVLAEANAIGTAYQQADYLPEADAEAMKALLREYLDLRISDDPAELEADLERSLELHRQMWAINAAVARTGYSPDLMSAFGDSLSEIVAVHESRVVAGIYARVPVTVGLLLLAGSVLSIGMVGYSAGLKGRRSLISAVVLIVALGIVLMLVIDLDRPADGLINVSQQALIDVQAWVGLPGDG